MGQRSFFDIENRLQGKNRRIKHREVPEDRREAKHARKDSTEDSILEIELLKEIFKYNPIVAAQVSDRFVFASDFWLGHKLAGNSTESEQFVGETGYVDLEQIVSDIKNNNKKLVVNFGDSSTSGWDSYKVNNGNPLFQYSTYSDDLRDLLGNEYVVANAGIPAHSSFQGLRRVRQVIDLFTSRSIRIDYATLYFGNNDSVCNGNLQDKDILPKIKHSALKAKYNSGLTEASKVVSALYESADRKEIEREAIPRVLLGDYKRNLIEIFNLLKLNNTVPILIGPVAPLYWKPGTRIAQDEKEIEESYLSGNSLTTKKLWKARGVYNTAMEFVDDPRKRAEVLEQALELDRVCPRIPKEYLVALESISRRHQVVLVKIPYINSESYDRANFVDYTHPKNELNKKIAKAIEDVVRSYQANGALRDRVLETIPILEISNPDSTNLQNLLLRRISNCHPNSHTNSHSKQYDAEPNMYTVRMSGGQCNG